MVILMKFIAHIRSTDYEEQTVKDHLFGVRELAESYGDKIGVKHIAGLAGLLHDLGKISDNFNNYIKEAVYNPDTTIKRERVDHSTAGGKLLYNMFHFNGKNSKFEQILSEIVGNVIISHHSYLHDFLSPNLEVPFLKRVKGKDIMDFSSSVEHFFETIIDETSFKLYVAKAVAELDEYIKKLTPDNFLMEMMFLTKYIFSCLIDADRTNSMMFEENIEKSKLQSKNNNILFSNYYDKLLKQLKAFQEKGATTPINKLRQNMSLQCEEFAHNKSGIYSLSIPTGGGKTLSSFRYALTHAMKYNKERIIYIVPYTTIIEQNAAEIRNIIGDDDNLLEYHSQVSVEREHEDYYQNIEEKRLNLVKDTWDVPIVFTTMVQFLNVFYEKSRTCTRRLHNLANSIIIFDEVQKVPTHCVSLFNNALNYLKHRLNSTIILCTATQPALDYVENQLDIGKDAEMIHEVDEILTQFERVRIKNLSSNTVFNNDKLCNLILSYLNKTNTILIILNTKKVVKELYLKLKEKKLQNVYHLSTSMCAAHRFEILDRVKEHLKNNEDVICVSTPLIEAGVDISFKCVIRSFAGLDSLAQAAGRCNRHGEMDVGTVYLIDHQEENLKNLKEIQVGKAITKQMLVSLDNNPLAHGGSILSRKAINRYFCEFYKAFSSDLNFYIPSLGKSMIKLFSDDRKKGYVQSYSNNKRKSFTLYLSQSFKTAADEFYVIKEKTKSVLVPYNGGEEIIADLNSHHSIEELSSILRKAQKYTVNLYENEIAELEKSEGLVSICNNQILVLRDFSYDVEFGLNLNSDSTQKLYLF